MHRCFEPTERVFVDLEVVDAPYCAVWNSLDLLPGETTITRSGTGLEVDFGDGVVFLGTIAGDAASLTYQHEHTFSDGCLWEAIETLVGTLEPLTCSLDLKYSYAEVVAESDGFCSLPCDAEGDVRLSLKPIEED